MANQTSGWTQGGGGDGNPYTTDPNTPTKPSTGNIANGTNNLSLGGWAGTQGFTPAMLSQIYDSPWLLLPYVNKDMSTGSAGYSRLRDMPADPLSLYNIIAGSQGILGGSGNGTGLGDYANFLNDVYSNYGSRGGRDFSSSELLRAIFGGGADDLQGAKTSLEQLLLSGDPSQQSRTLYNFVRDATNAGMNPLAAQGMQAAMLAGLDQYSSQTLTQDAEDVGSARDYIRNNMPWLAMM